MMPLRFLQTEFWASFKGEHGWKPYYFKAEGSSYTPINSQSEIPSDELGSEKVLTVLVRQFSLKVKKFSILFVNFVY